MKKELHEICELMMDKCVAPDSDWGGVGCDNMTVLIVAILNGRTKEQWYDWVADRVRNNVGYSTPQDLPDPFANRQIPRGPGLMGQGGPLSSPAQLLSNAISNGTLRFANQEDGADAEMDDDDEDDQDQYHKSPSQIDDDAMIEDTATPPSSSSSASSTASSGPSAAVSAALSNPTQANTVLDLESSATPSKLGKGPESPLLPRSEKAQNEGGSPLQHTLSPPSAVMGVQSQSPAAKTGALPTKDDAAGQES